jgi:hypothetical protein
MRDIGHEWTDEEIRKLEIRLHGIYSQAANEMQDKLEEWLKDYEKQRKAWESAVNSGSRTRQDYDDWLSDRAMERSWQEGMIETISRDAVNADIRARQIINDEIPTIITENANMSGYAIDMQSGLDTMFTLYDQDAIRFLLSEPELYPQVDVPRDLAWNRQKFSSAMTQSILQGESIPNIARRLSTVLDMDARAAVMVARTSTTYAESTGKRLSYERAKSIGIPIRQEWRANLDGRTRLEHRQADGQVVEIGEKFVVGGERMACPGDPSASAGNICNCRCRLQPVLDYENIPEAVVHRYNRLPKNVSYEDWKSGIYRTHPDHTETESSKKERGVE